MIEMELRLHEKGNASYKRQENWFLDILLCEYVCDYISFIRIINIFSKYSYQSFSFINNNNLHVLWA
jgi:hypothetical protein